MFSIYTGGGVQGISSDMISTYLSAGLLINRKYLFTINPGITNQGTINYGMSFLIKL
jgi:hypothetical protein